MIPAGIKAGSMAFKMLRTLYKAKKGKYYLTFRYSLLSKPIDFRRLN